MRILFLLFISVAANACFGQKADHEESHDTEDHKGHDHFHRNEIGVSFAPVYFTESRTTNFGLHGHYVRRLGETRFGAGLGVEYIFNESNHQTYSAVFQYSPTYSLHLVAAPGIALESEVDEVGHVPGDEEHDHHGIAFAFHLEAFYEFSIGPIDLGPSVEWAWDKHETHLSAGIHLAFPF